jgi:superkiller protein 3
VTSIKRDNTYAPSFTSLGFYYRDVLSPPDYEYSLQCFQKAFELDDTQDVAAEILAQEYALEGEWDLVEVVARRVVQVDRFGSDKNGAPQQSTAAGGMKNKRKHFWAWKAIGAADLVRHRLFSP